MEKEYDLIIIGAGPAGCMTAYLTAGGMKVLLVDRLGASKECGGLLAPDAQKELGSLGLTLPAGVLCGPQLFAVKALDMKNDVSRLYQRHYLNMDRELFDAHLRELAVRAGADLLRGEFLGARRTTSGVDVSVSAEGRALEFKARALAGADGSRSRVRHIMFDGGGRIRRYIALQQKIRLRRPMPHFLALFDSSITDFYGWVIPKGDYALLGVSLPHRGDALKMFDAFSRNVAGRIGFEAVSRIRGAFISRPRGPSDFMTGAGHVFLAGEAAGFISPTSSEGISYAFQSAYALAAALDGGYERAGEEYAKKCASIKSGLMMKNLKLPFMYNEGLRKAVMLSGAGAIHLNAVGVRSSLRSE